MTPQSARYKHYDLGKQPVGTVVEVALSAINNVRLMDGANYKLYSRAQPYKFFGGLIVKTPTKLTVPNSGHWHLVVDREGLPKLAGSNVRTIQPGHTQYRVEVEDTSTAEAGPAFDLAPANSDAPAPRQITESAEHSPEAMGEILKALDQYKRIANTDALTGLNNRRAFDEKLALLFAGATPLTSALVVSDVDHFKRFNDTHGHLIGDKVLMTVAEIMRSHAPEGVFVARAGGEEFAMIIEARSPDEIYRIAEHVRMTLEATPFREPGTDIDYGPITVSMGICLMADAADHLDMYRKADIALYASKNAGRNRCTVYSAAMQAALPARHIKAATAMN
jgi:diguanylate cyclase (GGDEF)-like protein